MTQVWNSSKSYNNKRYRSLNSGKEKQINQVMDRKEKSIKEFSKNKEISIAVSAAQRDGFLWCINHPDWKKEMSDTDRMEWINKTTKDILVNSAEMRDELVLLYGETLEGKRQVEVEPVQQEVNDIEL